MQRLFYSVTPSIILKEYSLQTVIEEQTLGKNLKALLYICNFELSINSGLCFPDMYSGYTSYKWSLKHLPVCKFFIWFFFFFKIFGCTHSIWKFPGQGLNLSCSSNRCCGNAGSFNPLHWARVWTCASVETRAAAIRFLAHGATDGTPSSKILWSPVLPGDKSFLICWANTKDFICVHEQAKLYKGETLWTLHIAVFNFRSIPFSTLVKFISGRESIIIPTWPVLSGRAMKCSCCNLKTDYKYMNVKLIPNQKPGT